MRNANADVYQEILENFLLPRLDEWFGDTNDFIFQDDNSLDLNPIENIWSTLKQTVNNKRPTNVMELLQAIT